MKILQTADLHLQEKKSSWLKTLKWLVNRAVEEECERLVVCGDLFEDEKSAHILRGEIRTLFNSHPELKVYLIPGNHDENLYDKNKIYGKNVELVSSLPYRYEEVQGWYIVLVPFVSGTSFKSILRKIPFPKEKTILFTHGTLYDEQFSYIYEELEKFARYMPIYSWEIEDSVRYIGLGHFHSKFVKANFKGTTVIYSGAPVPTSSNCLGKRKYIGLELDTEGNLRIEDKNIEIAPYWRELPLDVYPGKEKKCLDALAQSLEELKDDKVMLNLKIEGVVGMEEIEFDHLLENLIKKFRSSFRKIKKNNKARSWGEVMSNPAVKYFVHNLENRKVDEKVKSMALQLALDSFSKAKI